MKLLILVVDTITLRTVGSFCSKKIVKYTRIFYRYFTNSIS